jgi:2Fe-2S ferredoxin
MSVKAIFVQQDGSEKAVEGEVGETLMDVGRVNGVAGILGDCGGSCSCATCHVYVEAAWRAKVGAPDDIETSTLEMAVDVKPESRLSCQIVLRDELDGLRIAVAPYE